MKFVYKPQGAEPRSWDFDPAKLMSPEAEAIERLTGMTYGEWGEAVTRGSMTALHGLLYVMLKRGTPTLTYEQVEFCLDDIDFEVEDDEAEEIRLALEQRTDAGETLDESDLALLTQLRSEQADVAPKDPAPVS